MKLNALIFGCNSQDGFFLWEECVRRQIEVTGVSRSAGTWLQGDVSDYSFVQQLIKNLQPTYVFHLAANSTTRHSALFDNHAAISTGTINILEAVKLYSPHSKVFVTGSGVQFVNKGLPIHENDPFLATSAYAVARIQSVYAARYYRSLGIQTYVGYLFHHESPLRKSHHLSKFIADGVKRIAAGSLEKLEIGDYSVKKEWGYAGDIAAGIFKLTNQNEIFEATIGTGIAYAVEDWLDVCFQTIGKNWKDFVIQPDKTFTPEYNVLVSNNTSILSIGWQPSTSFEALAKLMMH